MPERDFDVFLKTMIRTNPLRYLLGSVFYPFNGTRIDTDAADDHGLYFNNFHSLSQTILQHDLKKINPWLLIG